MKPFSYAGLILLCLLFVQCDEADNYEILSFFFDGVPNPYEHKEVRHEVKIDSGRIKRRTEIVKRSELKVFFHEPFKERLCEDCHNFEKGNELVEQPPALCFNCHEDFFENAVVKHGPAAAGFCTQCHHPHFEKQKFMLKRKDQELCLYCHQKSDLMRREVHKLNEEKLCWSCHDPHASDKEFLLTEK